MKHKLGNLNRKNKVKNEKNEIIFPFINTLNKNNYIVIIELYNDENII